MCSLKIANILWKFVFYRNNNRICQRQQQQQVTRRHFAQEIVSSEYDEGTTEYKSLKEAIKGLTTNLTHIPIRIGETFLGSSDVHYQIIPHNTRWPIAQLSLGNRSILYQCKKVGDEVIEAWRATPVKDRIDICNKCADIIASESRHTYNASMMLGQSKTYRQAEEDTCRTINNLHKYAELLSIMSDSCTCDRIYNGYVMRATDGYIAAMTPYNWTFQAVNMVLCPALAGKCVIWIPSPFNIISSYQLFLAFLKAGVPNGLISFVPMNRSYFMQKVREMPYIAGINYGGRQRGYQVVAKALSQSTDPPNSFMNPIGPDETSNFHFVHESADVEVVARETLLAAFDYNGQRGNSCENLYVPQSLWVDLKEALVEGAHKLIIGDACEPETGITAVINRMNFDYIVEHLKYAERTENCKILCGGNRKCSYGNFIEPTIVICNSPCDKFMTRELESPILSVYVYANKEVNDVLRYIGSGAIYTLSGSIFAGSQEKVCQIAEPLKTAAANIYINRACIGDMTGKCDEMPDLNRELIAAKFQLLKHW